MFLRNVQICLAVLSFTSISSWADSPTNSLKAVLADLGLLEEARISPLVSHNELGIGFATLNSFEESRLSAAAHRHKRCGGFEMVSATRNLSATEVEAQFSNLWAHHLKALSLEAKGLQPLGLIKEPQIEDALLQIDSKNLESTVSWLSSYRDRYHKSSSSNGHVEALKTRITDMVNRSGRQAKVDLIAHQSTKQKTLRVRLEGLSRAQEVIVLGGHLDSINQYSFLGITDAPGADDNASGSANLLEVLRVLLAQPQLERSIEFFWYAGEEGGLLGSAEIATSYQQQKVDVVAALQLDMTLNPGSGPLVIASMTDFTSPWLRGYLEEINRVYVGAKFISSQCGYGCSDHASWFKNGYPSVFPFEAHFERTNPNIHSENDTVTPQQSNFEHSAAFSRLALAMSLELGRSGARSP